MKKILAILLCVALACSAFVVFASAESVNVALNKSYTGADAAIESNGVASKHNANLTDGVAIDAANYEGGWLGLWYNKDATVVSNNAPDGVATIVIDLEEVVDGINEVKVNVWNANTSGIAAAKSMKVSFSEDGQTYGAAVDVAIPEGDAPAWATATIDNASAQYVKLVVETDKEATWAFINEIEVYADPNYVPEEGGSSDDASEGTSSDDASEGTSSDDASEGTSSDDASEGTSSDDASEGTSSDDAVDYDALVGEENEDAKFELVITAPETYKAGDEITISVEVKGITAEEGLTLVGFDFFYDNDKLVITNDIDEKDNGNGKALDLSKLTGSQWEELVAIASNFSELSAADLKAGTQAVAKNDGFVDAAAATTDMVFDAVTDDGKLVFNFTFEVAEDATGDIVAYIPNASVEGGFNADNGVISYTGNAGYVVIEEATEDATSSTTSSTTSSQTPVKPGDASNMIIFAIVALVAIAGSAVVIKTRR